MGLLKVLAAEFLVVMSVVMWLIRLELRSNDLEKWGLWLLVVVGKSGRIGCSMLELQLLVGGWFWW